MNFVYISEGIRCDCQSHLSCVFSKENFKTPHANSKIILFLKKES
jgi:hypothetical protein